MSFRLLLVLIMLHDVFDLMDKISEGMNLGKMKVHECRLWEIRFIVIHTVPER